METVMKSSMATMTRVDREVVGTNVIAHLVTDDGFTLSFDDVSENDDLAEVAIQVCNQSGQVLCGVVVEIEALMAALRTTMAESRRDI